MQNNFNYIYLSSPLEQFEIRPIVNANFGLNEGFALTNHGLYTIIAITLILGINYLSSNNHRLVPNRSSVAIETIYASVHGIARGQIGAKNEIYTPFVYSLFWFLLISNIIGNVPYNYTTTTSIMTAIGLSIVVWIAVTSLSLGRHGIHFFSFFVPKGTPLGLVPLLTLIELVSYLARAVSLGVRLLSNMTAGHILIKILSTFLGQLFTAGVFTAILTLIPFAIFVALIGLEIGVSLIQSYVFTVLTCSYIKDAIELH